MLAGVCVWVDTGIWSILGSFTTIINNFVTFRDHASSRVRFAHKTLTWNADSWVLRVDADVVCACVLKSSHDHCSAPEEAWNRLHHKDAGVRVQGNAMRTTYASALFLSRFYDEFNPCKHAPFDARRGG